MRLALERERTVKDTTGFIGSTLASITLAIVASGVAVAQTPNAGSTPSASKPEPVPAWAYPWDPDFKAAPADDVPGETFRKAFVQLKEEHGLYRQESNGVTFLTPALFQASIPLPAEVPTGTYEIEVKLFADGVMIARTPSALEIYKAGFEQFVTTSAQSHGVLYGLATALMAILTGWFASVVFRRD